MIEWPDISFKKGDAVRIDDKSMVFVEHKGHSGDTLTFLDITGKSYSDADKVHYHIDEVFEMMHEAEEITIIRNAVHRYDLNRALNLG